MPGALLPERPSDPAELPPQPGPTVPGKMVVLAVLALGVSLVLGVGTFAMLTRPAQRPPSAAPASTSPSAMTW